MGGILSNLRYTVILSLAIALVFLFGYEMHYSKAIYHHHLAAFSDPTYSTSCRSRRWPTFRPSRNRR